MKGINFRNILANFIYCRCEIYDKYGRCVRCSCDYGFINNVTIASSFVGGGIKKKKFLSLKYSH